MAEGHRERLRERFLNDPTSLSDAESLELLLTFAIPRRDVRPLADDLLRRFGSLGGVLAQKAGDLAALPGMGPSSAVLFALVRRVDLATPPNTTPAPILKAELHANGKIIAAPAKQKSFQAASRKKDPIPRKTKTPGIRSYTKDLVRFALQALPLAAEASDVPALRELLTQKLPLNSVISRRRSANYLINRFFPSGHLDRDFGIFAKAFAGQRALKETLFYATCVNEPIVAKTADEVVWPALAEGALLRQRLHSGVEARLAVEKKSVTATAQAIVRTYRDLEIVEVTPKLLRLRLRDGDLNAFVFMLHREYPEPGMYELDGLLNGPLHKRLLWSKEWIRRALYRLRELGLVSKVTEIDQIRQFSTKYTPADAIEKWLSISEEERK